MSFMEYPLPDACRALMPTPEPHPPGPASRPMVCHMPKGHDGPHAITRRPRALDRRWEGDARPMTALPLEPHTEEQAAHLARIEAAEPAVESAVERVARAMWLGGAAVYGHPWDEAAWDDQLHFRNLAAAAIEEMKGPSPAEEALARVEALAEEYERRGALNANPLSLDARVHQMAADLLRAAIAAPVAQAGEGR